jgi:hypothetical protein
MNGPPAPRLTVRGESLTDNTGHDHQHDKIRRNRAQSYVKRTEWRKKRHEAVDDVSSLGEDLGHDVNDEKRERAE